VFEKLKFLRRRPDPSSPSGDRPFDQESVEAILNLRCEKDTFEVVEDHAHALSRGVTWRRRRLGWSDVFTGEDMGLCINELRITNSVGPRIKPYIAMAHPGMSDFEAIEYAYWQTHWASSAIRTDRGQKASRLFLDMRSLTTSRAGAPRGPWEDLEVLQRRVAANDWDENLIDLIPYMNPVLRKAEGSPLEVARYLPAMPPSWCVQSDAGIIAATNGGYFLNFPEEYEDTLSALHQPIGALCSEGQLYMPPWIERPAAVEWRDGQRRIELLGPENITLGLEGEAPLPLVRGIVAPHDVGTVWRSFDGELPELDEGEDGVDLVFSGAGLASVTKPGTAHPPIGGAIVRLVGEAAAPWLKWMSDRLRQSFPKWELKLRTSRNVKVEWALAAGPKLLNDGRAMEPATMLSPWAAGEFRPGGPPPTRYPYDADRTRGPRTAIGISADEEWVIAVIDGRTDMAHSVGLTLVELARLMRHLGCVHALNLDGGGSSVMAVEGVSQLDQLKPELAKGVVNIPCDPGARERIVPVALTITTK